MKESSRLEPNKTKEDNRIRINVTLLGICFTLFTFLIAFNPNLLKDDVFLTLQLVCAIPLFMTSLLARTKASYTPGKTRWTNFGFVTYILAYAFLINVVGIFLMSFVSLLAGFVFFAFNIVLALVYSAVEVSYDSARAKERFFKDLVFILILILLGILPTIGFH